MMTVSNYIEINGRKIGPDYPPYIIAELSANHNGDLARALQTIVMAKEMGADAVKLQTYTADTLTIDCDREDFKINGGLWDGYSLYQLYQEASTPWEWHEALFSKAKEVGITIFSTPFDDSAVDLLESLKTPAYKISSFEVVDLSLIERVAKTGKPMIISTGLANEEEIAEAVDTARKYGCKDLILLHCISSYPTPADQSNLRIIPDLAQSFNVLAGLSDHTLGTTVAVASIALGACVIEKHVTMSRADKGPDSEFSLEPKELRELCENTRVSWSALGQAGYDIKPAEEGSIKFRRSLYIVKDIKKGEVFNEKNLRCIRPGYGVSPKFYTQVLGKIASRNIARGTALEWHMVD